ncbi:transcriptional regulator [Micromonospora sp. HNM0581]|uniref:winged helix-turn-helix transcriptional regulator n=1 Tax=Micromonospora sp. HNM0581 TaxID=2716341 RepID=UPI00146D8E0E|nr:winged helix-turn-helix transcriptional regulator [Micromonospora sp. HNM0581]NLU80945.1 transcriptional regulator [Micromonospora sp. HNM0581]
MNPKTNGYDSGVTRTESGARRTYNQYCGLASALDVLGERWTLLIIRELLMGPRRYSSLLADLPGVGTNLLAERLKSMTERGLVRQVQSDSGARMSYALTEVGQELRPMVLGLAKWGMEFVGPYSPGEVVRPHWGFLAVEAMFQPDKVPDRDEQYQFEVDDQVFHVDVRDGRAHAMKGPADAPAMIATVDAATFIEIGTGRKTPLAAMVTGKLKLDGDIEAVLRCCDLIGLETGALRSHATAG